MTRPDEWQLEGDAAELYERYAVRYLLGPWAPGLVDTAGVRAGERVLDLACGTGAVARVVAERVGPAGRVTGLDLNPGMLAVARALPAPAGAAIAWIERSALDTGLPDRSFDVVLSQQGLQFLPDKTAALREMRRVLAPAGRVAISVWRTTGVYNTAVGKVLGQRLGADVAARFCRTREVPSDEELRRFAVTAGFRDVTVRVERRIVRLPLPERFVLGHLAGTPVAANVHALSDAARTALGHEVARELAPFRTDDGVAFPEEINVVTATA